MGEQLKEGLLCNNGRDNEVMPCGDGIGRGVEWGALLCHGIRENEGLSYSWRQWRKGSATMCGNIRDKDSLRCSININHGCYEDFVSKKESGYMRTTKAAMGALWDTKVKHTMSRGTVAMLQGG